MCRFLIYSGHTPIKLADVITKPAHSILTQSYDSRLRIDLTRPHNGDGFGIGYYTAPLSATKLKDDDGIDLGPEPCIFTSTIPAWNCVNLERIANKTASSLFFAHVRASTEGALADSNCHPFHRGALMWMHNGGIGGWKHGVKRRLVSDISDRWFNDTTGSTDSEFAFALFLDSLEKCGVNPDDPVKQKDGFGHGVLRKAMLLTIKRINGYIKDLPDTVRKTQDCRSLLNFAVADGHSVVCTRYVSSNTDEAASLFFSSGTNWVQRPSANENGKVDYKMERRDKCGDIVLVASEPLTFERDDWVKVPTNSIITIISNRNVLLHPIEDEYYNDNSTVVRDKDFATKKGQSTGDGMAEKA